MGLGPRIVILVKHGIVGERLGDPEHASMRADAIGFETLYENRHVVASATLRGGLEVGVGDIHVTHPLTLSGTRQNVTRGDWNRGLRNDTSAHARFEHHGNDERAGQTHADHADTRVRPAGAD